MSLWIWIAIAALVAFYLIVWAALRASAIDQEKAREEFERYIHGRDDGPP